MRRLLIGSTLVAAVLAASANAQEPVALRPMDRDRGLNMLDAIHWVLDSLYYDSTFGGRDEAELWWRGRQGVERAQSVPHMMGAIAQSLQVLDDSHTWFIPPDLAARADYGWTWLSVGDTCYVVEVERDAKDKGLRPGDRVLSIDGIAATRANLQVIDYVYHQLNPRRNMRVRVLRADGSETEIAFESRIQRLPPVQDLADIETQRRIRYQVEAENRIRHRWRTFDSVAVWGFSSFGFEDRRLDEHMRRARDYAWLILDLRGNPGGAIEGVTRLLGHFFAEPFAPFTQRWRDSTSEHLVEPRGSGGPFRGGVVVLVNSESASSAEIVARVLQLTGRGTVVGDRTMGAVMGSEIVPLAVGDYATRVVFFGISVTVFDVVMEDGSRLERVGVIPEESVLPGPEDFAERRDPALQRAFEIAGVRVSAREAGRAWRR